MTIAVVVGAVVGVVSTHMPLARHDIYGLINSLAQQFLLTCLLRGMTSTSLSTIFSRTFLLTCLLRGMTTCINGNCR